MENDPSPWKPAVVIRTPDHHLRVFVSSTLSELAEERKAVRQSINRLRLTPIMFESGARAHPAQDVYQAYLSQSHIFIGIYWQSYGWKKPGDKLSGLEDEYNRSSGLPRLIYIKDPAPNRDPALTRLLEHIREDNASSYKHFTTTNDLKELIENDLMLLLTEYFETASAERRSSADLTATTLTNVPIPRNPLVGRELELENACQLILRDDVALLTLTGPAGTGKSRLGIQIALDLRSQFKDGVYMVGLEYIRDPGLVIPSIAKTLGITETDSGLSMLDLLKQSLCKKQILLLLDNFEQVLKAAPQVGDLLEACPKVKALVTSRAPLHIRAEKELPIPPLAVPPLKESTELQPLSQYSAVQLFIQRCQAVKVDFQVTNENAPAVAEICSRLDGLPLAIELAAARIKLLPPQALLSRLERRFEVLRGGTKDLPERQKTMYSAIDWSYELLNDCEKQLFRRLSVFCGGCTIEAVLAVCNIENCGQIEVVDCLQSLVDNNLIRLFEGAHEEPRLSMLESIREFAFEHLVECGEAISIHERYEQFYKRLSEQAESELQSPTQQSWCKQIETELDNFRAVMSSAIECQKNELALQIALALWRFWWVQGYWSEGLRWMKAGLDGSQAIPQALRAKSLIYAAWLSRYLGDFPQAIAMLEDSLSFWRQVNDPSYIAMALSHLGGSVLRQGNTKKAKSLLKEALEISQKMGDKHGAYTSLEILGHTASKQGNTKEAIDLYKQAISLAEEVNDEEQIAKLLNSIGDEYATEGNYGLAEECFKRAAMICNKLGDRIISAYVTGNRGYLALKKGDYPTALNLLTDTIRQLHVLGEKESMIACLELFAYISEELGYPDRAVKLLGANDTLGRAIGRTRSEPTQVDFDENKTKLSKTLGETAFSTAWMEGSEMSLDQAIAYATSSVQ